MNYLDILILIPLAWGAYKGYSKGLIIGVVSLLALLLGVYGAFKFSDLVEDLFRNQLNWNTEFLPILSFLITFILIVVVINLLGRLLNKIVETAQLGVVNKLAGVLLGLIKTAFILSVLLLIFNKFDRKSKIITLDHKAGSLLYYYVTPLAPAVFPYLKNWYQEGERMLKDEPEPEIPGTGV